MKRSLLLWASAAGLCSASPAFAGPPSLPPIPSPDGAPQAAVSPGAPGTNPQPASGALSPQQLYEHVRRGIVAVERNGVPLAVGTVLDGDGRILTSLSALSGSGNADVRYADGTTMAAKVGQGDKEADLALLVPQSIHWTEGLAASEEDPIGLPLRAVVPAHGSHLGPAEAGVKGRIETHARDGSPLQPMLDVDVKGPLVAGAPLLDASGSVVAVLVRACKGAAATANPTPDSVPWATWGGAQQAQGKQPPPACSPAVVGAPVSAIRSFLARTPAASTPAATTTANAASPAPAAPAAAPTHAGSTPWLGIRGEPTQEGAVRGVRVVAVAPSSPSQKAGLRPDADTIVAADGHPIDTPENLGEAISRHAPGDTVKLLVYGDDKFREVSVELRPAP